jgi:hypothetical protein
MSARLDAYLAQLRRELRKHGVVNGRIIEEAREHLVDSIHAGLRRGIPVEAAEFEAFSRFGTPQEAAAQFAEQRCYMVNRLFMILSRTARLIRKEGVASEHYHDAEVLPHDHFYLRLKRPYSRQFRKMSAEGRSAMEHDPRERLAHFLRDFGRRTFGSGGTLESLTLLVDSGNAERGEGAIWPRSAQAAK